MAKHRPPKSAPPAESAPPPSASKMHPPESGVKVRMYRHGHGDCFLLAFRQDDGEPFYLLIDCGMKKGSTPRKGPGEKNEHPNKEDGPTITEVAENIRDATDGHLHLVVITHEHEDHVSGFRSERDVFEELTIDRLWLAWTEDPDDALANRLRARYKDTLLGLVEAEGQLKGLVDGLAAADSSTRRTHKMIKSLLEFELSEDDRAILSAAGGAEKIKGRTSKEGIQIVKKRADLEQGTAYLRPHMPPLKLPKLKGIRFFVLGPPQDELSLKDMDPQGGEEFHFALAEERSFLSAFPSTEPSAETHQPFEPRQRIPVGEADAHEHVAFFANFYGPVAPPAPPLKSSPDDITWRRIDGDWLRSGEQFALRMSNYINNTSLVMAIELPGTRKVLLFVGDAQRGNWVSWHEKGWDSKTNMGKEKDKLKDDDQTVSELLGRTVFYKVGHHGSHNATMNQGGLKEMAQGEFAEEFVAMIPANQFWAENANDPAWMHPLAAILKAVREKSKGRVFILDRDLETPDTKILTKAEWNQFLSRSTIDRLYYEFTVEDER